MAGAEAIVLCANTLHLIVTELEQLVQIPIIHVADATVNELRSQDVRKTALLGTKFTMEEAFFSDKLLQQGIEVMIPDGDERQFIHQTIFDELDRGVLLTETKVRYLDIIQNLIAKGAEDTMLIHAKAAARFALT